MCGLVFPTRFIHYVQYMPFQASHSSNRQFIIMTLIPYPHNAEQTEETIAQGIVSYRIKPNSPISSRSPSHLSSMNATVPKMNHKETRKEKMRRDTEGRKGGKGLSTSLAELSGPIFVFS